MGDVDIESKIQQDREKGRKEWDHPISFILAAVGSAVGLGNVWRFPNLVSQYGGAPFLIPYFFILIFVGMPILGMELSIGTFYQAGDADAFGSMNPRLRGIGLASVFAGYTITFYYCIILGYACIYFVECFHKTDAIPWYDNQAAHFDDISMTAGMAARKLADPSTEFDWLGTFNWKVFVGITVVWILIFLSIFKGVKSTSWVVKFTVPLPLLILLILIIRGAFLDGAGDGIKAYLIKWDGSTLNDPVIWTKAIGQVFFSLGVCMGVMTAYSSHNSKSKTNVAMSEKAISLSDTGIALLGGFAIYEVLGYMQKKCEKDSATGVCAENYYKQASMGLAFIAYPSGLATLEAPQFWGIIFFGCLIMLGIDSAFSLAECFVTFAKDCWIGLRLRPKTWMVVLPTCIVGWLAGLLYCYDSGTVYLDIIDNYLNNWGMVLIGTLECFAVGWVYKIEDQYKQVGKLSVMVYNLGFVFFLLIGTIVALAIPGKKPTEGTKAVLDALLASYGKDQGGALGVGLAIFFIGWILLTCIAVVLSKGPASGIGSKLWAIMGWHGADSLRTQVNNVVRNKEKDGVWVPNTLKSEIEALYRHDCFCIAFGFLIKYFSYALLLVVTCINIKGDIETSYGGYPSDMLILGQLVFVFMVFLVLLVAIFPRIMYDPIKHSGSNSHLGRLTWMFTPKPCPSAEPK
ncbi:sodium-dependent dopamine transporter-like isoform X3 [Bolinopsis microptera]|uniref:sodium-dependent dopamine transporter-like isoform X2 n=1 Tax=Bolinopsis microptera TaxID=2820187 RepID=UPI00307A82DC